MKTIVDTNVAVVANGRETDESLKCQLNCVTALETVILKGIIFIDDQDLIIEEYNKNLRPSGEPGTGDVFFKYILNNKYDDSKCVIVSITPEQDSFEEFPKDAEFKGFDKDDHKFVAVAVSAKKEPTILNASDSDWSNYKKTFDKHGIKIKELCK
jgi:hypothetical protein